MEGRIETHEGRKERRTEEEAAGDVALCSDFCSFTYSLFLSLRRLCDISYRPRNPYHWPTVQPSFVAALSISLPAGQYRPVPRERYKKKEVWRPLDVLCFLNWCAEPLHFTVFIYRNMLCKSYTASQMIGFIITVFQFRVILKSLKLENN